MSALNNKTEAFNLPDYIHIPFFLYRDDRLEKAATILASFFYSLHTSGKKITASSDYLCLLLNVGKRQFYKIMNLLEECKYIKRSGFTNRKQIHWIFCPKSKITVEELDTSALKDISVEELNTSALKDTKLVNSTTLNLCTPVHTYIKEDTKDNKKLTNCKEPSSSSFIFSKTTDEKLLAQKLEKDKRTDEEFLTACVDHVDNHSDKSFPRLRRANALVKLLATLKADNVIFRDKPTDEPTQSKTKNETEQEKMARYSRERQVNFGQQTPLTKIGASYSQGFHAFSSLAQRLKDEADAHKRTMPEENIPSRNKTGG